jgi:hypothetical protein
MTLKAFYSSAACAVVLCAASAANASTYLLDFTAGSDSGVVAFSTAGPWTAAVTAVFGDIDHHVVTGLSSYAGSDNTLYATDPHVSYGGVSVATTNDIYNFADVSGLIVTKYSVNPGGGAQDLVPVTGSITAVPEPAAWAMMLVGFGGVGAAMRSRRSGAAIV